jgi:succinate-semialdehyde dehydrogenase/glutarate-semialdehyde dehydrogenase
MNTVTYHYEKLELFVGGRWLGTEGRRTEPVVDPSTGETLAQLPHASTQDIENALASARKGFEIWRDTPAIERSRIMLKAAVIIQSRVESIAATAAAEQGKPMAEARSEVVRAADMIQFCAEEARRLYGRVIPARERNVRQTVIKQPVGPVAGFTPWNFPAISPARKLGGALGAGCSLVLKPSEEVPGTAVALVRAFMDAGLPDHVVSLVFGDPAQISSQLIASPVIRKIALTGSVRVGKLLAELAGKHMKGATMELGGHAPVIVCEDADPIAAGRACAIAKFRNAGQVCISPTRFYAHSSLYEEFCASFAKAARAIKVGPSGDPSSEMGPVVNQRRLEAVEELVRDAVSKGARVLAGGERIASDGFFYSPTVLADVPDDAMALQEEPFGPLALLRPFDDLEDAIQQANALPFGLAAYAFTRSARTAELLTSRLECGVLGINRFVVSEPETPFGGVKDSGYGREGGPEGMESYLSTKFVAHAYG